MRKYVRDPKQRPKHVARWTMSNAIKSGKLVRQPCEVCGNPRSHGHHDDYMKPLVVRWLCRTHHAEHHAQIKREASCR
jgi:hypothetical protein